MRAGSRMESIVKGINVLEQTPIKDYTTLSGILIGIGIGTAFIATIIFFIKTKGKIIRLKDLSTKIFLVFYILGLGLAIFSVGHFPWFYVETGRYTYKCTLEENISANYISNNFKVIGVEDGVWTIEDKNFE